MKIIRKMVLSSTENYIYERMKAPQGRGNAYRVERWGDQSGILDGEMQFRIEISILTSLIVLRFYLHAYSLCSHWLMVFLWVLA